MQNLHPEPYTPQLYLPPADPLYQGTKRETLKGTLGVEKGLYETMKGVFTGYIGY